MPKFRDVENRVKQLVIILVVIASSNAYSKSKSYAEVHAAVLESNNIPSSINTSLFLGLKNRKRLKSKNILTYKIEAGTSKSSDDNYKKRINYLFAGLKTKNGEYRIGRHDLPYSIVDNSMDKFFTKQSNGLVSNHKTSDLLGYINRFGDYGFFATLSPRSSQKNNTKPITSLMVNHSINKVYTGIALYHDSTSTPLGAKIVFTYKSKHKANKYGVGVIFEKCPANSNATSETVSQGQCSFDGGDSIYNMSSNYQFGKQYFSVQLAKNNKTNIQKQTAEYGRKFGRHTKAYVELDKTGSVGQTSIGLVTIFK